MIKALISSYNFIKHNKKIFPHNKKKENKILVEYFEYAPVIVPFSYIANVLAEKYNAEIIGYKNFNRNFLSKIKILLQKIWFLSNWNIYRSFGVKKLIDPKLNKLLTLKSEKLYKQVIKKIKDKKDVLDIEINKINIGDLIYDDYLREKNYSTIDIKQDDFKKHLLKMLQLFIFWENYMKDNNNVKAIVLSHTVYKYGIILRIAAHHNIKVFNTSWGCTYFLDKKNKLSSVRFDDYPRMFKILNKNIKKNLHNIAEKELNKKLSGKKNFTQIINQAQDFKSFSLNKDKRIKQNEIIKKQVTVLVAAHCFTDAVHAFDKALFLDFHDWLEF